MSYKFYGARINRGDYWDFHRKLKKAVLNNHPLLTSIKSADELRNGSWSDINELCGKSIWHVGVQLVPINRRYWMRWMSEGYWIENRIDLWAREYNFPMSFESIMIHTGSMSEAEVDKAYGRNTMNTLKNVFDGKIQDQEWFDTVICDSTTLFHQFLGIARGDIPIPGREAVDA